MNELTAINFHGDQLMVTEIDGKAYVVLKPAFEAIGLDADRQIANLQEQPWATTAVTAVVARDGKSRNMITADVRSFLMHLATIPVSRVAEHVRPKLVDYQCEVAEVIERHFSQTRPHLTEPNTVTWEEAAALIRQRYGIHLHQHDLTRGLRDAGVLKQNLTAPKAEFAAWFWFTGSAWTIHPHILPELVRKLVDTRRALGDIQSQLALDVALDEQLRREIGRR
ncbi:phage antirepressor N-terminal domain-containing protein [Nocardia rhizosphaerae]|uniref:Phage antirepressor N-terminal domain-containing protein n=1 Tax=Nocardia rhizosphaerae TaxID=1691571 RepID=A0ABV8L256_9NOCA